MSRSRSSSLSLVFVLAVLAIATLYRSPAAHANVTTFTPTADAYIDAASSKANFGSATSLATQASPVARSYLKFVPSGVVGTVTKATLRVLATLGGSGVSVRSVADNSWVESKINATNSPAVGGVVSTPPAFVSGAWVEFDVTSLVTGNGTYSLALTSTGARATYASRETGANAPQLVVETPTAAADPIIAAAGDVACDPSSGSYNGGNGTSSQCRHQYTSNLIYGQSYAAVLPLGDLQYDHGALTGFNTSYNPWWGRFKSTTRPASGNHEYETSGASGYFSYFGSLAGDPAKGYYSYDVGTWHLIALNSNCSKVGGCNAGSPQEQWLRADLAAHTNKCTLAYWHHPRFSSGNAGSTATDGLWKALYDLNADVVLSGHDHLYERFAPQNPSGVADSVKGIRQFTVGTGGKSLFSFATIKANSEVRNNQTYGILKLVLHPTSYNWTFVPEAGKTFTDTGSTACH